VSGGARQAGAALVSAVTDRGRNLEGAMAETASFVALEGRDRAFARAIASATLRRLGGIDALIGALLERPLADSAVIPRALLRTGAAQMLALDLPAHAVVSETVNLAKASRSARGFAGLINAVLRRIDREGRGVFAAQAEGLDLPAWLFARWRAAYGEAALAIAAGLKTEPPLDLVAKSDPSGWAERLGGLVTPAGTIRLAEPGPIAALPGYDEGAWWVQDAAAALPVRLAGDVAGLRVADLCAAPGGKTMQLAARGAAVTALDVDAQRLARLHDNLARAGLNAEIHCTDARTWRPDQPFDVVLLDAPCTATGALRRHPDAAWLRRPTDIPALAAIQAGLIDAAVAMLAPGGRLIYAVCSLEPEEGPGAVEAALARSPLEREPISPDELADPAFRTSEGDLRTHPGYWPEIGGLDGFFAARLKRT
jgi:16S rRNA (cytosine967-C5)-methyltransferase